MRGALLLGASSFSAAVACLGFALLVYSVGTQLLTPGAASTSKEVYFDLTQPAPVATASFLKQDLNSLRALSKVIDPLHFLVPTAVKLSLAIGVVMRI